MNLPNLEDRGRTVDLVELDFEFITDDRLRALLTRDAVELRAAMGVGAYKSVLVLAGSIIEALLIDYFLRHPKPGETEAQLLRQELGPLIIRATDQHVLSEMTRDLSTVVRQYRNLIHPGREVRTSITPTREAAVVSENLLSMIVRELTETYARDSGYTAEQVLSKIVRDPSCGSVAAYITDKMDRTQRERLFRQIPRFKPDRGVDTHAVEQCLVEIHSTLKTRIPEELLEGEVAQLRLTLTQGTMPELLHHLRFFHEELHRLEPETTTAIVKYMLDIVASGESDRIKLARRLCGFSFVGRYIAQQRLELLKEALERHRWGSPTDEVLAAIRELTTFLDVEVSAILEEWMETTAGFSKELKTAVIIPF